jgi:hypothetical protein
VVSHYAGAGDSPTWTVDGGGNWTRYIAGLNLQLEEELNADPPWDAAAVFSSEEESTEGGDGWAAVRWDSFGSAPPVMATLHPARTSWEPE